MNDKLKVILLSAVVALVVGLVVTYFRPARETVREIVKELGAVSGPDFDFSYFGINRVQTYYSSMSLISGTTTPCIIQNPTGGTSTLLRASARLDTTATTAASRFVWARANVTNATSTSLNYLGHGLLGTSTLLASGGRGVIYASTTALDSLDDRLQFASGDFVVLGDQGHIIGTQVPTGRCEAEWRTLNPR